VAQITGFSHKDGVEKVEKALRTLPRSGELAARVPTDRARSLFAEAHQAAAVGTLLCSSSDPFSIIWGITPEHTYEPAQFVVGLPGLTAVGLSNRVSKEPTDGQEHPVDFGAILETIENHGDGIFGDRSGQWRAVVEFDDRRAKSLAKLTDDKIYFSRRAFEEVILNILIELEVLWPKRRMELDEDERKAQDAARSGITRFAKEIFENAYHHGRRGARPGEHVRDVRFMRFRKFFGAPDELGRRIKSDLEPLDQYGQSRVLEQVSRGAASLIEVSISDFGPGMVDGFLSTPAGLKHQPRPRAAVLHDLLHTQLTSDSLDDNAGEGTMKALRALRELRAFASVRTNEFWWGAQFSGDEEQGLAALKKTAQAPIVGTHWQFVWALPPRATV
jgi:hypothetical protein